MTMIVALGLAAALVCVAALVLVVRERAGTRASTDILEDAQGAAALTDPEGAVLAANEVMRRRAPGARTLRGMAEAALGPRGPGSGLLYRMAREARARGCAHAELPGAPGESLSVRSLDDDRLAWTLLPLDQDPAGGLHGQGMAYAEAPFAHVRQESDATTTVNRAFRAVFGPDPEHVLAQLAGQDADDDDRILLTARDGSSRVWRHFARTGAADGARDVFLFPAGAPGQGRNSPLTMLESVPAAILQIERSGAVVWSNARAGTILGREAAPGDFLGDVLVPTARTIESLLEEAARPGAPPVSEMAHLRTGETYLEIQLGRARLYGRETLLAVLNDASEMRRLEDQFTQSQKMEAVGKLAGGVAHDFNNVLTAIIGHADLLLLRKDAADPDYADLNQIVQNANRAAALVRQLLAFSRKQTLNPVTLSVRDVIGEAHYLLDRLVGETVRLDLDFGTDLWPVRADPQQLEQVLMNLVVNARDAMDGAGQITIAAANARLDGGETAHVQGAPAGDHVVIRVRDTGPGIDPAIGDKVFDPFFTTKGKGEGTGLGLSTVYGIVRQSGGQIQAGTAPGGGAEIAIYLPRASLAEPSVPAQTRPAARDQTGSAAVLLVEDEAPVRAFAARALKMRGYGVLEAETGEEAMEILADPANPVDLLISDVVMPGMSGPEFATEARRLRPGLGLIFISGYAEEGFRESLTETEFLFLPKPFTLNQLTAKVKEALAEPA